MVSISRVNFIGCDNAKLLARAGIHSLEQLLREGATSMGRMRIADAANLDDKMVKSWVHYADLRRVEGVGPKLAEILSAIGVLTVPKLAYKSPSALCKIVNDYIERVGYDINKLSENQLAKIIANAKSLSKVVEH